MTRERTAQPRKHVAKKERSHEDRLTKMLKADFDEAHEAGKRALKERDFDALAKAIDRERSVIEQQRARLDRLRAARPSRVKR